MTVCRCWCFICSDSDQQVVPDIKLSCPFLSFIALLSHTLRILQLPVVVKTLWWKHVGGVSPCFVIFLLLKSQTAFLFEQLQLGFYSAVNDHCLVSRSLPLLVSDLQKKTHWSPCDKRSCIFPRQQQLLCVVYLWLMSRTIYIYI